MKTTTLHLVKCDLQPIILEKSFFFRTVRIQKKITHTHARAWCDCIIINSHHHNRRLYRMSRVRPYYPDQFLVRLDRAVWAMVMVTMTLAHVAASPPIYQRRTHRLPAVWLIWAWCFEFCPPAFRNWT